MAENKDVLFEGIRAFDKNQNAPDFIIAELVITPDELFEFLGKQKEFASQYNGKTQFKATIKRSKEGKLYASMNTYKKQTAAPGQAKKALFDNDESLPF